MTTTELEQVGKMEDSLELKDALAYLHSIGMKQMSKRTMYNRLNLGTGPEVFRRNGRLYFRKCDLDAFKKQETERTSAYSK